MENQEEKEDDTKFVIPLNDINNDITISANEISPGEDLMKEKLVYIDPCGGLLGNLMLSFWNHINEILEKLQPLISFLIKGAGIALFVTYTGLIMKVFIDKGSPLDWCHGYGMAFIIIALIAWCTLYYNFIKLSLKLMIPHILKHFDPIVKFVNGRYKLVKCSAAGLFILIFLAFVIYDTRSDARRLLSLLGIVIFILIGFIFSKHPDYIRWDTILTGICFQLLIGLLTIKIEFGRKVFQCVSKIVVSFLENGYAGAEFVFGKLLVSTEHVFAFQALSVLFFLSTIVQVLFYLGWLQIFCFKLGGFLQRVLGTTVIESVNAVSTVFLGMSEAPLLYVPYIKDLTSSELHCIMTSCFATVAGTLLAAYTSLGVDPKNVVTASAMAAPASLMFGKLFYPENQKSKTSSETIVFYKSPDSSIMDAACKGAFAAIGIFHGIIACVIASVSTMKFFNVMSAWLGSLAGVEGLTIEYLLGQIFIPLAWIMGVQWDECEYVGSLIGIKTIVNEFVAYEKLGTFKKEGKLTVRSEAIATFALCGFANPGSIATLIALMSSLCPSQSERVTEVAFRSFISGSITSFTSAAIVGLLTPENGF